MSDAESSTHDEWQMPSQEEIMKKFHEFAKGLGDYPAEERFDLIMTHYGHVIDQRMKSSEESVENLITLTNQLLAKNDGDKTRAFLMLAGIIAGTAPSSYSAAYALASLLLGVVEINSHLAVANSFLDKLIAEEPVTE